VAMLGSQRYNAQGVVNLAWSISPLAFVDVGMWRCHSTPRHLDIRCVASDASGALGLGWLHAKLFELLRYRCKLSCPPIYHASVSGDGVYRHSVVYRCSGRNKHAIGQQLQASDGTRIGIWSAKVIEHNMVSGHSTANVPAYGYAHHAQPTP